MKNFKEIYENNAKLLGTDDLHYGRQLYLFLERNKVSSKDLYDLPYSELGKTFVECPLTKARMIMIKENYIKNTLGMTKEEYLRRYPDVILIAESRVKNIKKGIHKIDPETGLTIHQKAINKASKTLKQVGDDGLTGYQKLGMKTKNTHMNNIDENGLNGYQRLAKVARPKQIETMYRSGDRSSPDSKNLFRYFRYFVTWLTKPRSVKMLDGLMTGRAGTEGAYQIDHIYSVVHAFNYEVSPWQISHPSNLRVVTWQENRKKSHNSECDITTLDVNTGYTRETSIYEFKLIISIIDDCLKNNIKITSPLILEMYNERTEFNKKRQI